MRDDHATRDDAARRREADAILRRVRQETEPQTGAAASRLIGRARDHFTGADAAEDDPIERLGTRIGRGLSLLVFLALLASTILMLVRD